MGGIKLIFVTYDGNIARMDLSKGRGRKIVL